MTSFFESQTIQAARNFIHGFSHSLLQSEGPQDQKKVDLRGASKRLPWHANSDEEIPYEELFKARILQLSQRPEEFLSDSDELQEGDISSAQSATAGDVLEVDRNLRQLRFKLVPKVVHEARFWKRYFHLVDCIKKDVMMTEMYEENDLVHVPCHPECHLAGGSSWLQSGGRRKRDWPVDEMVMSGHSESECLAQVNRQDTCNAAQDMDCSRINSQASSLTDAQVTCLQQCKDDATSSRHQPSHAKQALPDISTDFPKLRINTSRSREGLEYMVETSQHAQMEEDSVEEPQDGLGFTADSWSQNWVLL